MALWIGGKVGPAMDKADATVNLARVSRWILTLATGIAVGSDSGDAPAQAWAAAESSAQTVEILALSSVAGAVPERSVVRKAQAVAIVEARKIGIDLSIASVGTGGKSFVDPTEDASAFARLAQRFPLAIRAALERDVFRERLAKAWNQQALADSYNASAQVISDPHSRVGACVVEIHAAGETLHDMLAMTFHESVLEAIERKARKLGIKAMDIAFLAAAHESSHCVIGMARRSGLLDTGWPEPSWDVPPSWAAALTEDDHDVPALAKAEESAADLLAIIWSSEVLGAAKATSLARLSSYAVALGARSPVNDGLHDSSRTLARFMALTPSRRSHLKDATKFAWELAVDDTRAELRIAGQHSLTH